MIAKRSGISAYTEAPARTAAVIFLLSAVILHIGSAALHAGVGSNGYIQSAGLWFLLAIGIGLAIGEWKALPLAAIPWPIGIVLGPAIGRFPGPHLSLWIAAPESIVIGLTGIVLGVAVRKGLSSAPPPPLHVRHRIYTGLLAVSLLVVIALPFWTLAQRKIVEISPNIHLPILGLAILAVVGLLPLRPKPVLYALGLVCLLFAFIGLWFASPTGKLWTAQILLDPGYGRYNVLKPGWLLILLPAGWLLLARSVSSWMVGVLSYLAPGAIVIAALAIISGIPTALNSVLVLLYFFFLWPVLVFQLLGMFGMTMG
ncbi:hypothetical protein [Nitrolancea hollandica]|uniref:Uncharacterized protein n=1 Tax=Nitrolancea hollandica Lb TaxID=1129897 RepID=I4EH63_9BACT|nr:hypothetical protein [Nitrolancea hollandica]CCF84025.1 membrane hypothetical protein [Nitrolancea hollandica Lb]